MERNRGTLEKAANLLLCFEGWGQIKINERGAEYSVQSYEKGTGAEINANSKRKRLRDAHAV